MDNNILHHDDIYETNHETADAPHNAEDVTTGTTSVNDAIPPDPVQPGSAKKGKKARKKKERNNDQPVLHGLLIAVLYFVISVLVEYGFMQLPHSPVIDYTRQITGIIWPMILVLILGCGSSLTLSPKKFGKTLLISLPMILVGGGCLAYKTIDTISAEVSLQSTSVIILAALSLIRCSVAETSVFIGAVSRRIGERYGRDQEGVWYSAVMSGLIFGLVHLVELESLDNAVVMIGAYFLLGMLYAGVYYRGMSLWGIMLLHLLCCSTGSINTFIHRSSALSYLGEQNDSIMIVPGIAAFIFVNIVLRRKKIREAVENLFGSETAALLPPEDLTKEERRQLSRERELRRIERLKDQYADAPLSFRVFRIYMLKPLITILIIAAGSVGVYELVTGSFFSMEEYNKWVSNAYETADREKIEEICPIDAEGAARINALPRGNATDTWTVCVYLVGSDLEDMGENDLSSYTRDLTYDERERISEESYNKRTDKLRRFSGELEKNDVDLPAFLCAPVKPVAYEVNVTEKVTVADRLGAASTDLEEILSGDWGDNVNVIVQTCGARRWGDPDINPNRTQRFLVKHGKLEKIEDLPLQNSATPDALADFLGYCNDNYRADHNILVMWDHGGGSFGFGMDRIYGSMLSLADIRTALSKVYTPDRQHPAFDIIGFDACLMANLDVVHYLDGYASYLAVSEETEPNQGWTYGPWLRAIADDPAISPAQVSMMIADSYMDYYMTMNLSDSLFTLFVNNDVTFSVIDENKGCELYDAYCALAKEQLTGSAGDLSVIADIGRCGKRATHYAKDASTVYNLVDMGGYVDHLIDTYPEGSSRVKDLIGETVLYHRENGYLSDSQGISVYLPCSIDSYSGFIYALNYLYDICEDDNIRALYYYKTAGCLNDDMLRYVKTLSDKEPGILHLRPFEDLSKTDPVIDEEGFSIPISDELADMIVGYYTENAIYDPSSSTLIELGYDETAFLDGEGSLCCDFDGTWIFLDGVPLSTKIQSSTASSIEYRSDILYNSTRSYLLFSYIKDTDTYTINGVANASDENNPNILINNKSVFEVEAGSIIQPVYDVTDINSGDTVQKTGNAVTFGANSAITRSSLENGYYLSTAVITDPRGDTYYSKPVGNRVSHGQVSERTIDIESIYND